MEEKKKEFRYVMFPLCFLRETYSNPKLGLDFILGYGIVNFAKTFEYNITEVGRQLMYCYYRKEDEMDSDLLDTMQQYIDDEELKIDEDYCGFSNTTFDPLEYSDELLDLFESNTHFKEAAILNYQVRQAAGILKLSLGSMSTTMRQYKEGVALKTDFERQFGPDVLASVKVEHLFEFRDSGKDLDIFRAYVAIKSLIGVKEFVGSNKPAVLSRMIGCKSKEAYNYYTTNKNYKIKQISQTVEKYNNRYHMDRLLLSLAERKFIMFLSKEKCSIIYFSKYMPPAELGQIIKISKEKGNLKKQMRQAAAYI